jgi:hypothetical protein
MKRLKRLSGASALVFLAVGASGVCLAEAPVAWGPTTGAKGCVILRETEKLDANTSNDGGGTILNSRFELSVVTANGHALARDTWPDDQATMNELQRISVTEQTRFVKVKSPYTSQDLEAAQALCRQSMGAAE